MRMDLVDLQPTTEFPEPLLHTAYLPTVVRLIQSYEQRLVVILTALQVVVQMDLRPRVEINQPLLVPLPQNDAFPVLEIYRGFGTPV